MMASVLWEIQQRKGDDWEKVPGTASYGQERDAKAELHRILRKKYDETGNDPSDDYRVYYRRYA